MGGDAKKKQAGEENREPIHETEETTRSRSADPIRTWVR